MTAAADDRALLRRFEPVLRLTRGEVFVPVSVTGYVARAALWRTSPDGVEVEAPAGSLDLDRLALLGAETGAPGQALSVVDVGRPTTWRDRIPRRDRGERLRGGSRLAAVGVLSRTVDALSRLSLLLRGAVPGGSATLSRRVQADHLQPERPTYYGRVVHDGGYLVCQYWFFYAFNNWRSGFGGVNEHEADWEQVTVYLDATGDTDEDGFPVPRWVVFSAHDETGDDLRRRWDDPDLGLVDGRHPIVFVGAGSHSGAYLAGDYLITVQPPSFLGFLAFVRRVARLVTPWAEAARGMGIPFVDYARGDGLGIGPGEEVGWTSVPIGDDTPWVVEYRGLWGHDTRDRFGGERGPAGPRYERDGTIRASWADPVGWAGLAKVPPGPAAALATLEHRLNSIDDELEGIESRVDSEREQLRIEAAGLDPDSPGVRDLQARETDLLAARRRAAELRTERSRLERQLGSGPAIPHVHAHLRHRHTPIERGGRTREGFLGVWAILSTPLILWMLSRLVWPTGTTRTTVLVVTLAMMLSLEALARGYLLAFLVRAVVIVTLGWLLVLAVEDWQEVTAYALGGLAAVVLLVNLRDAWRR
ncbi:hypothetical protein [Nocardioides sp.]|uniref:hypothetical protein n=1 Tax=Nocardioides sp. TaxID=35761 RepID=UPI002D1F9D13|nr:hypothetical protein [Nocardioides sp.]